jgi:hypothetical protein
MHTSKYMTEDSLRTEQPAWKSLAFPLAGCGLFVVVSISTRPSLRWAVLLLAWALGTLVGAWWLTRPGRARAWDVLDRHAGRIVGGIVVASALAAITVSVIQARYFALGAHVEDTAYYNQVIWNTLHGHFLSGNLQQERLFRPPVSNDLALHESVVPFLILPVYAIFPHFLTILVLRDLALVAAAWPLFLLTRERMGGAAGVAAAVLYLANPAVLSQSVDAFYLLQFAPFPFFWALRAFLRDEFRLFVFWLAVMLGAREDAAVTAVGFGLVALFRGRTLKWAGVGSGLPVVWWGVATVFVQPAFGRWGNNVVELSYAAGGQPKLGLYQVLLGNPVWIVERLLDGGLRYFYDMLRVVAFLPMAGWEGVLAVPGLAANFIFARMFALAEDPLSRFALLPACALIGATIVVAGRLARQRPATVDHRGYAVVLLLLVPSLSLLDGAKDVVQTRLASGVLQTRIESRRDADALWEIVDRIPNTASVAAPHYALPALSGRQKLYYVQHLHDYLPTEPDFILLDDDLDRVTRNPERRARYVALADTVRPSPKYETVLHREKFTLLRRIDSGSSAR